VNPQVGSPRDLGVRHILSLCFTYFFILLEAMNENALNKLRRKVREKELVKKAKTFRRK
jgi:hypothetical protein